ncbi:M23 family metallopeptidase [Bacillus sp. ISL-35]|uniref:M23 family metallopeptidase n=1 Tax=Bacillus sp. ISL-35 TaxID=2819122 RepID=UPI001BEB9FB7|nr:M23 family metallopeptidase [Bacillus sp. ISL-35]MBT2681667.1 M23 family metallopeptidase [Bacillus sp. ISL-35]MBT2702297.1 M23 family metallopeptidase [Chryseobacterium sp. ISL-80]
MNSRADDIRRRMMKRKRERERMEKMNHNRFFSTEEERHGFDRLPSYDMGPGEGGHPLFKKEVFLFKILASACLVLIVAIIYRSPSEKAVSIQQYVKNTMEQEFQFAAVSDWYEGQFGKPLALLPAKNADEGSEKEVASGSQYALPASGKILEDFGDNGQRIMIETGKGAGVEAMNEGLVHFVGMKEGFGKTVIVQHGDKSETWYGNLDKIDVNLYEYISKGTKVGTAMDSEDGLKGSFYFAIKKGDDFVDPVQVIKFE